MGARFKSKKFCVGILIFFNCLINLPCFIYNYLQDGDELSSIALPVYLAGGDWSEIVANITGWHGYGHVIIYAPFFKLCKSWTEMYNICRIGSLIAWIFLSVFIFYMASKIFDLNNSHSLLIALACTIGILKPDYGIGLSVMSELPMGIIAVICMFLLIKTDSAIGIKKKVYSFLLFFLLLYSLTIHSRGIVLILTSIVMIFLAIILWKDMVVSPVFSLLGGGVGFGVYKLLNGYYVNRILISSAGIQASLGNNISNVQSTGVANFVEMFVSMENIKLVFEIFFSLLSGFSILSFGVISLFIAADIQYIGKCVKHQEKASKSLLLGILFGLISFFMMNGLIAIRQYKNVLAGDIRWFLYLRYAMPFAIMIVFTGLVVILKKKCNMKGVLKVSTLINVFLFLYFLMYRLQEIKEASIMHTLANIFRQFFYNGEKADVYFYKMIMFVMFLWFLLVYFLRKNKQVLVWGGYIFISIIFTASALNWHYNRAQEVYTYTDASEKIIQNLENENNSLNDIKIYCTSKGAALPRYLRTKCPWSEIHYIAEEDINSIDFASIIVLSDNAKFNELVNQIYKIELDDNEFLYTGNEDVYNWINQYLTHK